MFDATAVGHQDFLISSPGDQLFTWLATSQKGSGSHAAIKNQSVTLGDKPNKTPVTCLGRRTKFRYE